MPQRFEVEVSCAPRVRVPRDVVRAVERSLRRAGARLGASGEVRLRWVGDREIKGLNRAHMGQDKVTDVLSFPAELHEQAAGDLGDLALCWPQVRRQAGTYGDTVTHEAVVLAVHGLAHLLGHDHADQTGARVMIRAERRGLVAAGFADVERPYAPWRPQ